jgi:serine/threonine protein kinase
VAENWVGWPSEYPWEQEALDHVRSYVEGAPGYWAMTSFSFTSLTGRTRECDLLVVGPGGIHLVEIKSHPGRAVNQGSTWYFDRGRPVENPQALGEQKSKELKALLSHHAQRANVRLPNLWITASTFLSAADLVCDFTELQKQHVYGREGLDTTNLPGIWSGLLGRPPARDRLKPDDVARIANLLRPNVMGIPREQLEVGTYQLERQALEEGPTWRDHLAENTSLGDGRPRRVRIYTAQAETAEEREAIHRAAQREYLAVQGIRHRGIVNAEYFDANALDEGPAIVFEHGKDWKRLDQYLQDRHEDLDLDTRVFMIRQLADALAHAHGHRLYHRSLAARSIWVEKPDSKYPQLRITDWQTASLPTAASTDPTKSSMRALASHLEPAAGPFLAPEITSPDANKAALDVFGLGAVAYAIASGQAPAETRQQLQVLVAKENGLNLQTRFDDVPDELNDLIARATCFTPSERTGSVQDFSEDLDKLEAALATADDPDPLLARPGESFGDFKVKRVLGTGSFGRALLVERSGEEMVLKVALGGKEDSLRREASYLRRCRSNRIISALADPISLPKDRTGLLLEYAGESSLGKQLREDGALTRDQLRRFGSGLFSILEALDDADVRHRDIKPDNIGLQGPASEPRLVLFDFSLAGAAEDDLSAGTHGYLDPYLGTNGRNQYDTAAEYYAVAATLYAMSTGEDPGQIVDPENGSIDWSASLFEPSIKDGLTAFFKRAFDPDLTRRHSDRLDMQDAFRKVFEETVAPSLETARAAVGEVRRDTPLRLTDLDLDVVSAAETRLGIITVGDLIDYSATRIAQARGVGRNARNLLIRARKSWIHKLPDAALPSSRKSSKDQAEPDEGPLPVDTIADAFIPRQSKDPALIRVLELYFGLSDEQQRGSLPLWLSDSRICEIAGVSPKKLASCLESGYVRLKSGKVKGIKGLQETILEGHRTTDGEQQPGIIERHGRIMPVGRLAAALLEERGASLDEGPKRLAHAAACVRAVMMFEERISSPRFEILTGLHETAWLAALASQHEDHPNEDELRDWARRLATAAEALVKNVKDGGPLPTAGEAIAAFTADVVRTPDPRPVMSDRDLFELACRSTEGIGLTPRLELYPTDLPASRAVRIAGIASRLREPTAVDILVDQVRRRFPALEAIPAGIKRSDFERILREDCGFAVDSNRSEGTLWLPEQLSSIGHPPSLMGGGTPASEVDPKLDAAVKGGGFLAIRTSVASAPRILDKLASKPGIIPVDVTEIYMDRLRSARDAMAAERNGKPTWETVLKAGAADAPPRAKENLRQLSQPAWETIRQTVVDAEGIVLLHDAAPLARLSGGMELLQELIAAARQRAKPFGLWLLCPTWNIERSATLDGISVGALEVDNEQLQISRDYLTAE